MHPLQHVMQHHGDWLASLLHDATTPQMTPADTVVETFGGIRATARVLEVAPSSVLRWLTRTNVKGAQGRVPQRYFDQLIVESKKIGKPLTANDLLFGRINNLTVVRDGVKVKVSQFDSMVASLAR